MGTKTSAIGDDCFAAAVEQVKIEEIDDKCVSFSTRSASPSGDPNERLLKTFTVPLTEVYCDPVSWATNQVELAKGKIGTLFLSRVGWDTKSSDGFQIYGKEWALFKAPDCAASATRLLTRLAVVPESIVIRAHLEGEHELFEIDLLGPDAAESQQIRWSGADYISLRLSQRGARRLGLKARAMTVRAWPVRLRVTGAPKIDPTVTGAVELLDARMADPVQELAFGRPGAPVELVLTQDGVSAFHVTPQLVAELTGETAHHAKLCVGCTQTAGTRARSRVSRVTRRRTA